MKDKTVVTASGNKVDESVSMKAGSSSRKGANQQCVRRQIQGELRHLRNLARRSQMTRSQPASRAARSIRDEIDNQIRLQPFKAVAVAAVVGFVYGLHDDSAINELV